jgi:hypothetical protein
VLTTGCAWRHLPAEFGVSKATAHRRFVAWTQAGLWRRLHRAVLDRLGEQGGDRLVPRGGRRGQRAGQKGGPLTGPNPVDRGKPGSKLHVLTDARACRWRWPCRRPTPTTASR